VAHRETDEREEPQEANRDEHARGDALENARWRPRQPLLPRADVEREECRQKRRSTRIEHRHSPGDERDGDRYRADDGIVRGRSPWPGPSRWEDRPHGAAERTRRRKP